MISRKLILMNRYSNKFPPRFACTMDCLGWAARMLIVGFMSVAAVVSLTTLAAAADGSPARSSTEFVDLVVAASPQEGGKVTGSGKYAVNSFVDVEALPAPHYRFKQWQGDVIDKAKPLTSTIIKKNGMPRITAVFELLKYKLHVNVIPGNGGSVEGGGDWPYGSHCVLVATPREGYKFAGWEGAVKDKGIAETSLSTPLQRETTVVARFEPISQHYTLTLSSVPSIGGTVKGAGVYEAETKVTVEAIPAQGYRFAGWEGPVDRAARPSANVFMIHDTELKAKFALNYVMILPNANPKDGGKVSGDLFRQPCGVRATITATPAPGYKFKGWTGIVDDPRSATTTVTPHENITYVVEANFELIQP